jgi:hypothetical protein
MTRALASRRFWLAKMIDGNQMKSPRTKADLLNGAISIFE